MTFPPSYPPAPRPLTLRADPLAASFATTYAGVVAFIAVVAEGSFARAADRLGIGRSAVSRSVQKLEDQLNVRLFLRTTRSTTLTREGDLFYANCHPGVDRIVQAVEEMRDLREGPPRGHLRIGSPVGFGRKVVAPLLREFRAAHPDVSIDLMLDDKSTDFISDRVDIAFRNGRMEDAQIIAKQIIPMQLLVCASREYRDARGLPDTVEDLALHQCINFRTASGRVVDWEFKVDGQACKIQPQARLTYNDPDLVLQAVLDGQGIAQMSGYLICDALRSGALVPCLVRYAPDDRGHYICYLSRQHLPSRMRVFIDFMTTRIRASDLQCLTDYTDLKLECSAARRYG
ncbi:MULTISPECIES: LysR family transcriptional regulator [unclassified Variovorax]|uniref:LysR family transcriptional regulator n=1 Tax=unclassified Variovorax TaxID=663243 RepID=UPI00076C1AEF|nr:MULTISPECIES: LysR family transcriptional regulator [unclassified Variovorax]KWT94139.1 Transcriptional regulator, LysR family [Variovorax sp. WDL1]PNG59902.1 HTH-type transcriptional regulator PgrR [Variovorax sp. B4]PNG60307.1 HTH-type transcriptional regulator PgrR [Variovorax sp. B2]VTV13845.1 D-malate degradation protein R [Variovorax sp. WDL1]